MAIHQFVKELGENDIYLAGEQVEPGIYYQLEGGRRVLIEKEDFLPASFDGRVACYRRASQFSQSMATKNIA